MIRSTFARLALAGAAIAMAAAFVPATVSAQKLGIAVNPYVGYYHFDQSSFEDALTDADVNSDLMYGVRVGLGSREGVSLDLGYGHASTDGEITVGDVVFPEDSGIDLFYGAVNYQLPIPVVGLFISGGAGAIRYSPEDRDAQTDVLVNYGAGVSFPLGAMRIRADLKDHLDVCRGPDDVEDFDFGACADDTTLHNIEASVGVELAL
jgi:hypothetical protein